MAAAIWLTVRVSTVVVSLLAWFLLSNHCAIGAIVLSGDSEAPTSGCAMHSAPAKKKPAAKSPCCKDVRAVMAKTAGATTAGAGAICARQYTLQILRLLPPVATAVEALDTGPPGRVSFAELVLQESMLAHAPPVS
jgi:hypothetical protein